MLVGEMRDTETVDVAIKAALTGHLVLSTVHTNDSASTVHRLVNMNVEPFLIADSIVLIVAQRLVRKICKKCAVPQKFPAKALVEFGFTPEEADSVTIYQARGCDLCNNTGYKGRTGLFEVLEVTPEIRDLILTHAQVRDIKKRAIEQGMLTLRRSGLIKVKAGITTIEDVLRETVKD
jgi:type IV pilus assembly protein PilB